MMTLMKSGEHTEKKNANRQTDTVEKFLEKR